MVTKSGFHDVDHNDPARLVAALDRRSSARLYAPYRDSLLRRIESTGGPVVDVGAGGGHLVERIAAALHGQVVLGVEPSSALVRTALEAGRAVVRGEGHEIPLPDASAKCVISERVLQHVEDIQAVLAEIDRVLQINGLVLLADPDHAAVRLSVPHLQDLADRLVRWRARAGTASPAAAALSLAWLSDNGYTATQETFWCSTADFTDARVVTNFPEWAQLSKDSGEVVSGEEVAAWEAHWRNAADSPASGDAWFNWPIVVTEARKTHLA